MANPAQYIVHSFLSKDHYLCVRLSVLLCVCLNVKVSAIKRTYRSKFCMTAFYNLCAAQDYFNILDVTPT